VDAMHCMDLGVTGLAVASAMVVLTADQQVWRGSARADRLLEAHGSFKVRATTHTRNRVWQAREVRSMHHAQACMNSMHAGVGAHGGHGRQRRAVQRVHVPQCAARSL